MFLNYHHFQLALSDAPPCRLQLFPLQMLGQPPASVLSALTIAVTLVTVDAVVDVTRHIRVTEIGRVVPTMTTGALEHRVIV
jgi:hypothetical protein